MLEKNFKQLDWYTINFCCKQIRPINSTKIDRFITGHHKLIVTLYLTKIQTFFCDFFPVTFYPSDFTTSQEQTNQHLVLPTWVFPYDFVSTPLRRALEGWRFFLANVKLTSSDISPDQSSWWIISKLWSETKDSKHSNFYDKK